MTDKDRLAEALPMLPESLVFGVREGGELIRAFNADQMRKYALAAIAAHDAQRAESGAGEWVMVPREPTREQWEAGIPHVIRIVDGDDEIDDDRHRAIGCVIAIYKDLLAAAQETNNGR